jgi:ABC-type transport system substrate-binding protein
VDEPGNDVRVRRAISHAIERQALIESVWLAGEPTPAVGRGLSKWLLRVDQLGPGAQTIDSTPRKPNGSWPRPDFRKA